MQITLTRSRTAAILDAIRAGRPIPAAPGPIPPANIADDAAPRVATPAAGAAAPPWPDDDLLAGAAAMLAELLRRRERTRTATTDEALRCDKQQPYHRLSDRVLAGLNYCIQIASAIGNGAIPLANIASDKTYRVGVYYASPEFWIRDETADGDHAAPTACGMATTTVATGAAAMAVGDGDAAAAAPPTAGQARMPGLPQAGANGKPSAAEGGAPADEHGPTCPQCGGPVEFVVRRLRHRAA